MIYVASSWKNPFLDLVHAELRGVGLETYDFREHNGFDWRQVHPDWTGAEVDVGTVLFGLHHPLAVAGFQRDMAALKASDELLCVLPCGNSAHAELGFSTGAGKSTAVLLPLDRTPIRPDLMWKMAAILEPSIDALIDWALKWR